MELKKYLEEHPLPILVVVVGATVSLVSGFMQYKLEQRVAQVESEYFVKIATLKNKLGSIERKIGEGEESYFNVSKLLVPMNKVKAIDPDLISSNKGQFFYAIPEGVGWKELKVSEPEWLEMSDGVDLSKSNRYVGLDKNMNVWEHDEVYAISFKDKDEKMHDYKFKPYIVLQIFNKSDIGKSIVQYRSFTQESEESKGALLYSYTEGEVAQQKVSSLGETRNQKELENEAYENKLNSYFDGDVVSKLLFAFVMQQFDFEKLIHGAEVHINSVQKQGNVMYMQITKKINGIGLNNNTETGDLILNTELIVVSNSKSIYLVKIEMPSYDGRPKALAWISEWLSSLRIPI